MVALSLSFDAGWDKKVWKVEAAGQSPDPFVKLAYVSKDGEEGYPGTVHASVTYTLTGSGELRIAYEAITDQPTHINMTNHSYFNLHGENRPVTDHVLTLHSDRYLVTDETVAPTGEIRAVSGTPYDFTQAAAIGKEPGWFEGARGYDNCFVLHPNSSGGAPRVAAKATSPLSNISLEVLTTQPGIQFYSSNFFAGTIKAKSSQLQSGSTSEFYNKQYGFALETQHFPDSPNQPTFPSTILRPGETYKEATVLRLSW